MLFITVLLATAAGCDSVGSEPAEGEPETTYTDDTGTTTPPGDETEIPPEPPPGEESTTTGVTPTSTTEAATTTEETMMSEVHVPLETGEQLYGLWHDITPGHGVYVKFDADGNWGVYLSSDVEAGPYEWGTFTLDGAEITMIDDPDAPMCPDDVAIWTVAVSKDGEHAYFTFVEDSCTESVRGEDWTLVRHSP
jgi:hypothetical protein